MSGEAADHSERTDPPHAESLRPLQVYDVGPPLVIGFDGRAIPDDLCLTEHRAELGRLIEAHGCRQIAFDLSDVKYLPSGMLGLLVSLTRELGVEVQLFNPSPDVRETLEITKLDRQFQLRDVEV
ncbi:MAG: STAS domain-containing protein [Planctomycetales bacterium]